MFKRFSNDENAAIGLPVRLVVNVILLSVFIGLSAKAVNIFLSDMNEKKILGELDRIDKTASMMYIQGGARDINVPDDISGTIENIHVEIPDSISYVVLGGMPSGSGTLIRENPDSDNIFYYEMNDGRVHTRSSIARFMNNTGQPVVLYPGVYDLTMELVKDINGTYVSFR